MKNTLLTVLGVIAAVMIAWVLVDVIFSVMWFVAKLVVVAVVAVAVFAFIKMALSRK